MRVVIRRRLRHKDAEWAERSHYRWAIAAALFFQSLVFVSFAICVWRWSFDLGWVAIFLVDEGLLGRWQIWFALAAVLQLLASLCARYARSLLQSKENERDPLRSWLKRPAA